MKMHNTQYDLSLLIYIPIFMMLSAAYYFDANLLVNSMAFHWLLVPLLVYTLVSPASGDCFLRYDDKVISDRQWLRSTILFSIALACLFQASAHLFSTHTQHTHQFFPFDFFALFTIVMAGLQQKKHKGLLSSAVYFWFGDDYNQSTGVLTDSYARITNLLCLACCAFVVTLLCMQVIAHFSALKPLHGLNTGTTISMTATLMIMNTAAFRTSMRQLINFLPLALVVPLCITFILALNFSVVLLVNTQINVELIHFDFFERWHSVSNHAILYYMFLGSWGLIYCGFISHVAQGRSVRTTLFISIGSVFSAQFISNFMSEWLLYSCAIVGSLGLLITLVRTRFISNISRATMMSEPWFKKRPAYTYLSTVVLLCAIFFGSYVTTGATAIGYLMLLATLPTLIFMLMSLANLSTRP